MRKLWIFPAFAGFLLVSLIFASVGLAAPALPFKDATNAAQVAVINRGLEVSFTDAWIDVNLDILHHERCTRVNKMRVRCAYSYSFKRDDNHVITHIESGLVDITPNREIFVQEKRRQG
jgi:hypothetical protein